MNKKAYYINPYLFFIFEKEAFCLWNYDTHEQFEIEKELISLLIDISQNKEIDQENPLLADLIENDVVKTNPYDVTPWGWDQLSRIFHRGTQNVPELQEKRSKQDMIKDFIGFSEGYALKKATKAKKQKQYLKTISLSKVDHSLETLSFSDTLNKRLTSRHFSGEAISESLFSTVLYYTFGEIHAQWEGGDDSVELIGIRKSSPSAGGIHSIQAYITVFNVEGVESGLYLYDSKNHSISLIHNNVDFEKLIPIMADQFYMEGLAFGVFLVSDLTQVWSKYLHSRAYREIFLDAGHLSQTFQLTATSLSLNTWLSGYFRDDELMEFLDIKEKNKVPIIFVGVGKGNRTPLHPDLLEGLKKS
jgi:SagB-type dehydrogenase family enzyme